MLRRQHKVDDQHHDMPLIYYMEGHKLHFGRREFSLITGFHFGTVLSHERSDRQAKLKFIDEFSSMTSDLCDSLNSMFADLIEPADPDEDIGQDYLREEELRLCLEGEEKMRWQIKCKFLWNDDYIVDRNFWLKLVCLDPARKCWLTEEVFIPINETGKHWCLAQFHIMSGEVTFYDTGHTYDYDYRDWDFQLVRDTYVSCQHLMVRCEERHEQILELQNLVGSTVVAECVRLLQKFQQDDLELSRGMMRLICET
ncbi:phospholipase-like protein [Tanacetum coccineum]